MRLMERWPDLLRHLDVTLFTAGDTPVTVGTLLGVLLAVLALLVGARWMRRRLLARALAHSPLDPGTRQTVAALVYYMTVVIGLAVIMQSAGLKLSAFSLLAGAVGVGVGFGLQNIISNFFRGSPCRLRARAPASHARAAASRRHRRRLRRTRLRSR